MTGKQFLKKTFAAAVLATAGIGAGVLMEGVGAMHQRVCLNDASQSLGTGTDYDRSCSQWAVWEMAMAPAMGMGLAGAGLLAGVTLVGRRKKSEEAAPQTTTSRILEKTFYGVAGLAAGGVIGMASGWTIALNTHHAHYGELGGLPELAADTMLCGSAGVLLGAGLGAGLSGRRKKTPAPDRT